MKLINVYDDNSVYVGEMVSGKREGWGSLYILDDYFAGYKIVGHWFEDKLNGRAQIVGKTYTEEGWFSNGVPSGLFFRNYNDGRRSYVNYQNGKNVSEERYSRDGNIQQAEFGFVKLSESEYYLGDTLTGFACGYGMIYSVDTQKKITGEKFVKISVNRIDQSIELTEKRQSNKR